MDGIQGRDPGAQIVMSSMRDEMYSFDRNGSMVEPATQVHGRVVVDEKLICLRVCNRVVNNGSECVEGFRCHIESCPWV